MNELKKKIEDRDMRILLTILLTVSMCLNFYLGLLRTPMIKETRTEVIKRDTIVNIKKDFDTVYISKTKYKDIYHYDTIHHNDIVYVKDTVHNYAFKEKDYNLDINAVRLDNYKLDIHTKDTIKYTETVYQTIYKPKKNKIAIGVQGGYGYGFRSKQLEPYVGLGITINLFEK